MKLGFARLLRQEESLVCAHAVQVSINGATNFSGVVLVVKQKHEGAVIILQEKQTVVIQAVLALHSDVSTQTMQLGTGFACQLQQNPARDSLQVDLVTRDIAILQELLLEIKKLVALADEVQLTSSCRSHQWLNFYQDPQRQSRSDSEVVSRSSSSPPDGTTGLDNTNPFILSDSRGQTYSHEASIRDRYLQDVCRSRAAEFTDVQQIQVHCSTWNMAGQELVESLRTLLEAQKSNDIKIYSIAFQEVHSSAEAYITTMSNKRRHYQTRIEAALGDHYQCIECHQLVGILICVYAHKSVAPAITSIQHSHVACGVLGMVGNKGAVGIKFNLMDTSFAFLSCHFAAGQHHVERRNSDWVEVEQRIFNNYSHADSALTKIDHLFLTGDLNYRVQLPRSFVMDKLTKKDFDGLLDHDQLRIERHKQSRLSSWSEGQITFPPTFKFDIGTSEYDTSEKQRIPAWTDRILTKSSKELELVAGSYRSLEFYYQSDHKPVIAIYRAQIETILTDRRQQVRAEITQQLDRFENDARPVIRIREADSEQIQFGDVRYQRPISRSFVIENTGKVMAEFTFIPANDTILPCKRWVWPCPVAGSLKPNEEIEVHCVVCVDALDAVSLNNGHDQLHDVLVLHVQDGVDQYIPLKGNWLTTCIGHSLEALASSGAIRSVDQDRHKDLQSIPKTLHRICDHLTSSTKNVKLFSMRAQKEVIDSVQDSLDTDAPFNSSFDQDAVDIALCEILLAILSNLTTSVIPDNMYEYAMTLDSPLTILDHLSSLHANVLIYLQGFMTELIRINADDAKLEDRLCAVLGEAVLRPPKAAGKASAEREPQLAECRRFMKEFLAG